MNAPAGRVARRARPARADVARCATRGFSLLSRRGRRLADDLLAPLDMSGTGLWVPEAELHLIDSGHFALEDRLDEMGPRIHRFLDHVIPRS